MWFAAMFYTFCCYLVFFSSGYGFREVLPPLSFLFLLAFYAKNYAKTNLSKLYGKYALLFFLLFLVVSVATSINPWESFLHVGRGINKQYLVFFIALECAQSRKTVRILCWMCLLACYLQGLACVHQALTGNDIIHGDTLIANRLTGTMAWYWVGSYILLAGIPALALVHEIRHKFGPFLGLFLAFALFWPQAFGIVLGGARASYLALLVTIAILFLFYNRHRSRKTLFLCLLIPLCALFLLLFFCGEGRFSLSGIFGDSRLLLWRNALDVFAQDPLTGVGAWQYRPSVQSLPNAHLLSEEILSLSHPHNVYLQVLCETGIIGFLLCFGSLFFLFFSHAKTILMTLLASRFYALPRSQKEMAHIGFFFAIACMAFFVHGIVGHDFFRPWYQSLFFCHLGIVCGIATRLSCIDKATPSLQPITNRTTMPGLPQKERENGPTQNLSPLIKGKRPVDLLLCLLLLLPALLLGLLIALAIKLESKGPVFFRQTRIGKNGRSFQIIKFRTMVPNADTLSAAILSETQIKEWQKKQKLFTDPRVTKVGAFLRRYSLDELPQFINVVTGDMSLIGPRPIVEEEKEKYGTVFEEYCLVRPGLTGLWQVSGRNNLTYEERVAIDHTYITQWSPWLDTKILILTIPAVFSGKGAY
ncbi:MAG: sugar transferase [Desulfovibrio sp.]|nr:sugar transferase [Desulfovibrio sp.]